MARAARKKTTPRPMIVFSQARDIPFNRIRLSASNVRETDVEEGLDDLTHDIDRREDLIQGLNVRAILDDDGTETGDFETPAGGRRYRSIERLVKAGRFPEDGLVPCIVKKADAKTSAVDDSLAENILHQALHPLDQFRAFKRMVDAGVPIEEVADAYRTTTAYVTQRLRLADVSPKLLDAYAAKEMTLAMVEAFTVNPDHQRQELVWELISQSYNKSAGYIRQKLTENTVRVSDRRVLFIGVDAYLKAGGGTMRDLFEPDDGGWLTDPDLLDRLVHDKLQAEAEMIRAEGWKWVEPMVVQPYDVARGLRVLNSETVPMTTEEDERLTALQEDWDALRQKWEDQDDVPTEEMERFNAIDAEIDAIMDRPEIFAPDEIAWAGAFVSIASDGRLSVGRGYVRPEDEPSAEGDPTEGDEDGAQERPGQPDRDAQGPASSPSAEADDADDEVVKPLPDRLVTELTAFRTLALQDAFAQNPSIAFAAVLHAMVLSVFYFASRESCLEVSLHKVSFIQQPSGLRDTDPAKAVHERHERWKARLPKSDADLWEALIALDGAEQANLFAHCAAFAVNAQFEVAPKYDNGRISARTIDRRLVHSHVLARAVGLDLVGAGWKPTVDNYFGRVTKPRILADVAEAKGSRFAEMIDHLKKGDMAREAERLLEDASWLPEPLRTPEPEAGPDAVAPVETADDEDERLPAFLEDLEEDAEEAVTDEEAAAIAAE
jgi:ParB family transcriptional regulator, chromosome partitioning protein